MSRVLVNCALHPEGLSRLREAGFDAVVVPESDPAASFREAPDAVGLVANASLPVDDAFLAAAPRLRAVGRLGVGYDNVDVAALDRRAVRLVNTPLPIIEPVAEHAFGLLLALTRAIVPGDAATRAGRFREGAKLPGVELRGKTLGVVGFGNTGRRVAEIGRGGFGMDIVYADTVARPDAEAALGARRLELAALFAASDVISIHVTLGPSTRHLVGGEVLRSVRRGALLLNLSRGPVVDESALIAALDEGRLAGAGLDVFEVEPPPRDHPLFGREDVVLSPHRAGYSAEGIVAMSIDCAEGVIAVLGGAEPRFPVNGPFRAT